MADDILKNIPLPADLPENWTSGQIIAPTGAEAGLDDQHGYNYLMRQVNNAQKAAKELNKGKADSVVPHDLSIPITGWQTDTEVAEYPHYIDITADVTSTTVVSVSIDPASADVAGKAMLVNPETRTGAIRIRAHNIPTAEISARWYPIKYGGQFYGDGSIYSNFLLAAHPVGSIYQTISPENPAVTFGGGTWERIEGRFIMGASDTYPAGSTGGSATKTIAKTNLPNEKIGVDELDLIRDYASVFGKGNNYHYYIFSKGGFTDGLLQAQERGEVRLITLEDLYK